ncbi:uncharacterized protein LOC142331678 [Lycorma delicatula]|uniref:uncharacterized protein LOC142331678 n=1 Tax=Lycorma delicatula TaxID=130591 RepID=UPI003F517E6F
MAGQLLSRTGTNSQVLSLNLTNLIILLILKGLLFGAAFVGSGTWKGRSLENNINENIFQSDTSLISESELLLLISYLIGETTDNYDCLKRVACNETKKATQYIVASKMFIGSAKLLKNIVPINKKYEELIGDLQHAINFGKSGGKCEERYYCTNNNNINNNIKN